MQWYFWVFLIVSMFIFAYLMKLLFKAKLYYFILSIISSKKAVKILDKFKNNWFWLNISKIGIFLGFGFLGILYWHWEDIKKRKLKIWLFLLYCAIVLIVGLFIGNFSVFKNSLFAYIVNVVVFFFFGFAGFGLLLLGYQAFLIIKGYVLGRSSCPGVAPVIPGVTIPGTNFKIPFFEGWIALILIMFVHELSHGILARKLKIKVKSLGVLLLGFFPIGAFTEPDEEQLKKTKPKKALLVYSAGPTINLVFALIVFILFLILGSIFAGYITNVQNNSSNGFFLIGLQDYTGICNFGVNSQNKNVLNPLFTKLDTNKESFFKNYTAKIISIDGNIINTKNDLSNVHKRIVDQNKSYSIFVLQIQDINKNNTFIYDANFAVNSDYSFGIETIQMQKKDYSFSFWYLLLIFILTTMQWTYMLSFIIGLFNFMPIKPLDGGAMLPHIVNEFLPEKAEKKKKEKVIKIVAWTIIVLFLLLLIINALPLFI